MERFLRVVDAQVVVNGQKATATITMTLPPTIEELTAQASAASAELRAAGNFRKAWRVEEHARRLILRRATPPSPAPSRREA